MKKIKTIIQDENYKNAAFAVAPVALFVIFLIYNLINNYKDVYTTIIQFVIIVSIAIAYLYLIVEKWWIFVKLKVFFIYVVTHITLFRIFSSIGYALKGKEFASSYFVLAISLNIYTYIICLLLVNTYKWLVKDESLVYVLLKNIRTIYIEKFYYKFFSPITKIIFFLIILYFAAFILEKNFWSKLLIIIISLIQFLLCYIHKVREGLSIEYYNLDLEEIVKKDFPLYSDSSTDDSSIYGSIIRIDLSQIINDAVKSVHIYNHKCFKYEKNKIVKNQYVYYYIKNQPSLGSSVIKFMVETENKQRWIIDVNINFILIEDHIFIDTYEFYMFKIKKAFLKDEIYFEKDFELDLIIKNNYQINISDSSMVLNQEKVVDRKWLLHNDKFGRGKSTLDIFTIYKNGFRPVIISPWEDNYDDDFLYLIFDKMRKRSVKKFFMPKKDTIIIFLVSFSAIFVALWSFLNKEEIFLYMKDTFELSKNNWLIKNSIISLGVSLICSMHFLPHIIIFKKDSSRAFQSFYYDKIKEIFIKDKNLILLIEDIDRIDVNALKQLFRILSKLNREMSYYSNCIGIISCNKDHIEKKFKDNICKDNDKELEDIYNKIIKDTIFDEYDSKESLLNYLEKNLNLISIHYEWGRVFELDRNKIVVDKNFRDIQMILNIIFSNPDLKFVEDYLYDEGIII